jgi:hypothetical protein
MAPQQHQLLRKATLYAAALAACAGVFMLYTQPDVLVTLAQQVWACF